MSTATNVKTYKAAWQTHVIEFHALFDAAGKTNDHWNEFIHDMQIVIDKASQLTFEKKRGIIPTKVSNTH
jgi:hypothetical protein